jgi:hypothetical protein
MKSFVIAIAFLYFVTATVARAADPVSGTIKVVQGNCSVQRGAQSIVATEGLHLLEGDALITGSDGHLAVIMRDGTRLSLGPGTKLKIDQFVYNPSEEKFSLLLNLGRGILAYVSGKIASFSPEAVRVQTPVGAIGLRGTKFVVGLGIPADSH